MPSSFACSSRNCTKDITTPEEWQMQTHNRKHQPTPCLTQTCTETNTYACSIPTRTNFRRFLSGTATGKNVLLLDLDNTLTDTRRWFADFILDATEELASELQMPVSMVNSAFADVALATTLHEYAFVVESICSLLNRHKLLSFKNILHASEQFWNRFAEAHQQISIYEGVKETLSCIRNQFPSLKIVILTDSPEWVALERLSVTGLLPLVDGVVAVRTQEPRLRLEGYRDCIQANRQRIEAVMAKVNKRHLILNLSLPAAYAKPSSCGIELVARRLSLAGGRLIICGDKDSKEGKAAHQFRSRQAHLSGLPECTIDFVRANYGNHDLGHSQYVHLGRQIRSLASSQSQNEPPVAVARSIERFEQLFCAIGSLLSANERQNCAA